MNQKITMRMAKASPEDIDTALRFPRYLDCIDSGCFPGDSDDEEPEDFDADNADHLERFHRDCMAFFNRRPSGLMRVVWGFATVADNNLFDPDKDYLELNPALWENADPEKPTDLNWLAEKVCGELPEGYSLQIDLERGCGECRLIMPGDVEIDGHQDEARLDKQVLDLLELTKQIPVEEPEWLEIPGFLRNPPIGD